MFISEFSPCILHKDLYVALKLHCGQGKHDFRSSGSSTQSQTKGTEARCVASHRAPRKSPGSWGGRHKAPRTESALGNENPEVAIHKIMFNYQK